MQRVRRPPHQAQAADLGDATAAPQPGDHAGRRVPVGLQRAAAEVGHDVLGEHPGLPDRVLRGRRGEHLRVLVGEGGAAGEVGDGRAVAGREHVRAPDDLQHRRAADLPGALQGQVGPLEQRVRPGAGGEDDGVGRDDGAVGEAHFAVEGRGEPGADPHLDAAAREAAVHARGRRFGDLGHDPPGGLDEHPAQLGRVHTDLLRGPAAEVLELAERLHPGEPATDDDEGQQPRAAHDVGRRHRHHGRGGVEAGEDVVAQRGGVADGPERQPARG